MTLPERPRLLPCSEVNPELWAYYCRVMDRPVIPSPIWTEHDVVASLILKLDRDR